jgi:hypothetical protein
MAGLAAGSGLTSAAFGRNQRRKKNEIKPTDGEAVPRIITAK